MPDATFVTRPTTWWAAVQPDEPAFQDADGVWHVLRNNLWVPWRGPSAAPAKDASEDLECPKSGCQRPKPAENASGGLTCWWCGHTGGWHEFPKRGGK